MRKPNWKGYLTIVWESYFDNLKQILIGFLMAANTMFEYAYEN